VGDLIVSNIDVTAPKINLLYFDASPQKALKEYDFDEDGYLSMEELSVAIEDLYYQDPEAYNSIRENILGRSSLQFFQDLKSEFLILEESFPLLELEEIQEGSRPANLNYWLNADVVGRFGTLVDAADDDLNTPEGALSIAELKMLYEADPNRFRMEISKIQNPTLKTNLTDIYSKFTQKDFKTVRDLFNIEDGVDVIAELKDKFIIFQGCDNNGAMVGSMPVEEMTENILSGLSKDGHHASDAIIISYLPDGTISMHDGGVSEKISRNELATLMRMAKLYDRSGIPMTFKKVIYVGHGATKTEVVDETTLKGYAHIDIDHTDDTHGDVTFDFSTLDLRALMSGHYLIFSCAAFLNSGISSSDLLGVTRSFAASGDYSEALGSKAFGSVHMASFLEYMSSIERGRL
jgi:hypothetical protein